MKWTAWRSNRDRHIHVISPEGAFDDLPLLIRQLGPWHSTREGQLETLRPLYRAQLRLWGFAFAYLEAKDFRPEG